MVRLQMWLVPVFASVKPMARLMHTAWGWPLAESLHFIGLSLLVGTVGLFDLRLLGLGRRIPIAAMHRLIPWGLAGFGINAVSGIAFLLAEPDQYVYNPSFSCQGAVHRRGWSECAHFLSDHVPEGRLERRA